VDNNLFVDCKSKIKSYWDSNVETHKRFLRFFGEEKNIWKNFISQKIKKDSKVLEFGCGTGNLTELLIEESYDVKAIDISTEMLKNFGGKGNGCDLILGDAELPPLKKESFDVILCRNLVCTLPNPGKALEKWYEILRNGGSILIIERPFYGGFEIKKKVGYFFAAIMDGWLPWKNCYDEETAHLIPPHRGVNPEVLASLAEKAGFRKIRIEDMKGINIERRKAIPFYHNLLFEDNFCLIAKKSGLE